jgi:hypothetical protein
MLKLNRRLVRRAIRLASVAGVRRLSPGLTVIFRLWHLPAVTVSSSPHPLLRGKLPRLDRAGPLGLTRRDRLEIEATFFGPHRLPVETERDDIFGSASSRARANMRSENGSGWPDVGR